MKRLRATPLQSESSSQSLKGHRDLPRVRHEAGHHEEAEGVARLVLRRGAEEEERLREGLQLLRQQGREKFLF